MKCDKCHEDKPDVMRREVVTPPVMSEDGKTPIVNPALCTDCCSQCHGREWMRK